jgi:hypothetical protein
MTLGHSDDAVPPCDTSEVCARKRCRNLENCTQGGDMSQTTEVDQKPAPAEDSTTVVNRLAQLAIGLIPVLVAGLAAIGSATGGLARLFRDQNRTATVAVALVLLSIVLAAMSRGIGGHAGGAASPQQRFSRARTALKAIFLLLSVGVLFVGLFIAISAQIAVMGTSQAPQIFGSVQRNGKEYLFQGGVKASGVTSDSRITLFAYQTDDDANTQGKPTLLQSSTGPDADGEVNVPVRIPVHSDKSGHLVVLTAVLGEHQRDCDGRLTESNTTEPDTRTVACLVVRLP